MNRSSFPLHATLAALASVSLLVAAGCGSSVSGGGSGGSGAGGGGAGGSGGCVVGGCSGQTCEEPGSTLGGTCEWSDVYACYHAFGTCERGADAACGWRQTAELAACVAAGGHLPATGACVKNAGDACTTDLDCQAGGCGGELCFNPAASSGASTCECVAPAQASCGCVSGQCAWWKTLQ
jgi:hypothetical protein